MGSKWIRRPVTCLGVAVLALVLVALAPIWVPISVVYDLVGGRHKVPTMRLLFFAVLWAWLEVVAVVSSTVLWLAGQGRNRDAHYALQRWWSARVIDSLRATVGLRVDVEVPDDWGTGPYVALCRHASLGDAIMSCWVLSTTGGLKPRYVLKKELKMVPTLDIFGHRLPNYFVDRASANVSAELTGIEQMADGLGGNQVAVIFPEGSRASTM
ncbi:MAG: lysophospholipid acyltransferase family protein, partial [Actinomycetota bacterium]